MLAFTSALGPVAMQILLPALPLIADRFAVSSEVAQLTLSLSMLSIAFGTLCYGPLSDKFGRKPVMLLGISIAFTGSLVCYFAPTIEWLIGGRIVQAFGGAVGLVLARAIVRDMYDGQEAARLIATLVMVMVVMPMMSPAVGGELLARYGLESVFLVTAAMCLLCIGLLAFWLPESLKQPVPFEGVGAMIGTFHQLLTTPVFAGYALCVTFVSVVFFSFIAAAPEIMVDVYRRPATEYGYYFVIIPLGFMAGNYVARHFAHTIDINRMIATGAGISVTAIVATLALQIVGVSSPLALFLPIAVVVFGNGITLPNAQAAAINEFPRLAGSASGLTGFLQMACSAAAAQSVALLYNGSVYPLLLLMFTASSLSLFGFLFAMRSQAGHSQLSSN
jgi:DHA1 family bicyclomycin/chloramphenicol resistance-like MFS transporter